MRLNATLITAFMMAVPVVSFAGQKPVLMHVSESSPHRITATGDMISTTPEGTLYSNTNIYRYSKSSWLIYSNAVASVRNNDGFCGNMVIDGNDFYILDYVSEHPTGTWIKGTLVDDNTVEFKFPQQVGDNTYISRLTPVLNDDGKSVSLTIDESNCDLYMKWDGTSLTQIMPVSESAETQAYEGLVGLTNGNGQFNGYGELGSTITIWTETPVMPADDAATTSYSMSYSDSDGESKAAVTIARKDDIMWIQGLYKFIPEAWVEATVEDGTIVIPSGQYIGSTHGYHLFFFGADTSSLSNPVMLEEATLTAEGEKITAGCGMMMAIGHEYPSVSTLISNAVLTPAIAGSGIPTNPCDFEIEAFSPEEGIGLIYFVLQAEDTDGNPLDTSKLFYNIYMNGELYTFEPDVYFVDEPMTDIPYNYNNDADIMVTGDGGIIVVFYEDIHSIGVRAGYRDGENVNYSEIVSEKIVSVGIDKITDTEGRITRTEYFNLQGSRIDSPAKGEVCIERNVFENGTSSVTKKIAR